jgi:release factor glutamine methyltransferase
MLRSALKKILFYSYRPLLQIYLKRERYYTYKGIRVIVLPGVFHPGFFYSTKFLFKTLAQLNLDKKHVLELGAGSGFLSVHCAKKGAFVTSSDISSAAVENIKRNALENKLDIKTVHSNLFLKIPKMCFDFVVINPPYFKKDPTTEAENAWYCGQNMEYFVGLFQSLPQYVNAQSLGLMVLSDDCDIKAVQKLAESHGFKFSIFVEQNFIMEKNYIFSIRTNSISTLAQ